MSRQDQKRKHRKLLYERDEGKCFWCHRSVVIDTEDWPIPFNKATLDHIIPRSKGGRNHPSNMILACFPCNNDRGDMSADEYLVHIHNKNSRARP